jgi:hypothetical protein
MPHEQPLQRQRIQNAVGPLFQWVGIGGLQADTGPIWQRAEAAGELAGDEFELPLLL